MDISIMPSERQPSQVKTDFVSKTTSAIRKQSSAILDKWKQLSGQNKDGTHDIHNLRLRCHNQWHAIQSYAAKVAVA